LFTFNLVEPLHELMGVVAPTVSVRVEGIEHRASGPLLITHWGFSGPAVLRLSAWAARELNAMAYRYAVRVNWLGRAEQDVRNALDEQWAASPRKAAGNASLPGLPSRLWEFLLERAGIERSRSCGDVGKHDRNRLIDVLVNDRHAAEGKTTFKEEFVTAGGVDLAGVHPRTMESLHVPGLYFGGEVLDIDGITGGFNFQAAWTTGRIAGISAVRDVARP
jgi:predicted Rossmann fold flavoprotein